MHLFFSCCDEPFLFDVVKYIKESDNSVDKISATTNGKFQQLGSDVELIEEKYLFREETVARAFEKYKPVVLDKDILEAFGECKEYFHQTLDRVFINPRSSRSQDSFFHELLSYHLGYFQHNRSINCVFFDASPHFPWDIVLFFVARYCQIETRILRRTLIENRVILDTDFRVVDEDFVRFSLQEKFVDEGQQHAIEKESFWMQQSKRVNSKLSESVFSSKTLAFLTSFPWMFRFCITHYKNYKNDYMQLRRSRYFAAMLKQKIQILSLKEWLRKHCVLPDLSMPYVYFAMHFQPERTTDPEAGVFSCQYLAIKLLADILPDGWKIYVKEHPRQVNSYPDVRYRHYRSVDDYMKISSLPNVFMVHPTFESHLLIESCTITASATGSTVWEGMLHGKPGINFGRVWHKSCESSLLINSITDAIGAFVSLSNKSKETVLDDVKKFLNEFRTAMIVSVNYDAAAKSSEIPRKVLVANLAQAIVRSLPCQ